MVDRTEGKDNKQDESGNGVTIMPDPIPSQEGEKAGLLTK